MSGMGRCRDCRSWHENQHRLMAQNPNDLTRYGRCDEGINRLGQDPTSDFGCTLFRQNYSAPDPALEAAQKVRAAINKDNPRDWITAENIARDTEYALSGRRKERERREIATAALQGMLAGGEANRSLERATDISIDLADLLLAKLGEKE